MSQQIFRSGEIPGINTPLKPSVQIYRGGGANLTGSDNADLVQRLGEIERSGGSQTDITALLSTFASQVGDLQRAMNSQNVPTRENLEAEAAILIPTETPLRNRLPRREGSGKASTWKTVTSLGGGYGYASVTTSSGNASGGNTITVASIAGLAVGDQISIGVYPNIEVKTVTAINAGSKVLTLDANLAANQNSVAVVKINFQPGGGAAQRAFFAEGGAPSTYQTTYADNLASYKLLGAMGSVTGFAMAVGAAFQNQLAVEKTNGLRNAMLNEENALINADGSSVLAPWGDGANALAYDGMLASIATAKGTPYSHIQSNVGPLTLAHLDAQIIRLWQKGAQGIYLIMSGQEIQSMAKIAQSGGAYRIMLDQSTAKLGTSVSGYIHPITGEVIPILPHRFLSPGTIIFGCDRLPDGKPAADVEVLPQVQLPQLAPNQNIQGYVAQEIAPSKDAPQDYPFLISVFSVFRMKSAIHFAKSTGVTPA